MKILKNVCSKGHQWPYMWQNCIKTFLYLHQRRKTFFTINTPSWGKPLIYIICIISHVHSPLTYKKSLLTDDEQTK